MRLTLRTLLAYLDDRLPPNQAKEIGQKVTTSPFATELADRIKSVVRRRRLAKESSGQKTIDANLIAEYLDDQLTPELVSLIEKEILSSDATLAEVAATHQVIGMLNDPVELSEPLKERLYRLGPQPDRDKAEDVAETPSDWKPLEPQAAKQKRSPMLLLGVMVLGWLGLVATDSDIWQSAAEPEVADVDSQQPELNDPLLAADQPGEQPPLDVQSETATVQPDSSASEQVAPVTEVDGTGNMQAYAGAVEPPPVIAATDNSTQPMDSKPNATSTTSTDSIADSPPATTSGTVAETSPPATTMDSSADATTPKSISLQFVDAYSMAVKYDRDNAEWTWASDSGVVSNWKSQLTESIFAVAAPFDVQVIADEAGWIATLHGSTLFRSTDSKAGIELIEGGLIVQGIDNNVTDEPFTIRCGEAEFQIAIPEKENHRIGVTVTPVPVNLLDTVEPQETPSFIPERQPCVVTVFAVDAEAAVFLNGRQISVGRRMQLQWQSNAESDPTPGPSTIPEWMYEITNRKTDSVNELLTETASEFRKSPTVADAAADLLESRNPLIAANAVQLPVVTRQLDDLCSILLESDQTLVRRGAIEGLQNIMLSSAMGRQKVSESLRTRLPAMDTENALKLLAGMSRLEAEDQYMSTWLVEMLENNRPALRELAIFNLDRLTGTDESFQADDEPSRRGSAVRRWKKFLSRNDGRLLKPQG